MDAVVILTMSQNNTLSHKVMWEVGLSVCVHTSLLV